MTGMNALDRGTPLGEARRRLLAQRLKGLETVGSAIPRRAQGVMEAPLSPQQRRLWLLNRLDPADPAYVMVRALVLEGRLRGSLACALEAVVARHEILRTRYVERDGAPVQVIDPPGTPAFETLDLAADGPGEAPSDADVAALVAERARRPFDLAREHPIRALLLRLSEERHVLALVLHHVCADAASLDRLLGDLRIAYETTCGGADHAGPAAALPPLALQYADYAAWSAGPRRREERAGDRAFWRAELEGAPRRLALPADGPARGAPGDGLLVRRDMAPDLVANLRAFALARGTTPFVPTLAAFGAWLRRICGGEEVLVGTPRSHRDQPELEPLVGFFVETVPLRVRGAPDEPFEVLAERLADEVPARLARAVPFDELVETLGAGGGADATPLVQALLAFQPPAAAPWPSRRDLRVRPLPVALGTAKFDLVLYVEPGTEGWEIALETRLGLFTRERLGTLVESFLGFLEAALAEPATPLDRLALITPAERRLLTQAWSEGEAIPVPEGTVPEAIVRRARLSPDAPALVEGETVLAYGALDTWSALLAARLARTPPGPPIAVWAERRIGFVVAMLAILRAGRAYLPIDPAYPPERIAFMLADSGAATIVVPDAAPEGLPKGVAVVRAEDFRDIPAPPPEALPMLAPQDCAYVVYTSGSTGRPKGVAIPHRGLSSLVAWHTHAFAVTAADRATQAAGTAFDACAWEVWPHLAAGASVTLVDPRLLGDPDSLWAFLARAGITIAFLPTSIAADLVARPLPEGLRLRVLLTGGEALNRRPPEGLPFHFVNAYGPTENSVVSTCGDVAPATAGVDAPPPIGRPIANSRALVLDRHGEPVPIGVVGELHVGGPGLALGYLGRPELTAERFVTDPRRPGERLYRTGDAVRWRPDGTIAFVGRTDDQVKIRGLRIEPGEIEAALEACPGVRDAAVLAAPDAAGETGLRAFVAVDAPQAANPQAVAQELAGALARRLPAYMVPATIDVLAALPLTPNGKADRAALLARAPAPRAGARRETAGEAPATATERALAAIWSELLGRADIARDDAFFALGGHSLLALRMLARVETETGVRLDARAAFEAPTLAALASRIDAQGRGERPGAAAPGRLVPLGGTGPRRVYAFPGAGGALLVFADLVRALGADHAVVGVALDEPIEGSAGDVAARMAALARACADAIRAEAAGGDGPLTLLGWSFGGLVACETARALIADGAPVPRLVLVDTAPGDPDRPPTPPLAAFVANIARRAGVAPPAGDWDGGDPDAAFAALSACGATDGLDAAALGTLYARFREDLALAEAFVPAPLACPARLIQAAAAAPARATRARKAIAGVFGDWLRVLTAPGDHFEVMGAAGSAAVAAAVRELG
ncbi:non-ribosomal peptide synthetase [Salinarimonas sp. NSM]|uniref:non-ribosomal peptide synthetase n=1 Tax=Salinarimonas sp. NSM TaxID=3458003 RepID=UPI004035BAF4